MRKGRFGPYVQHGKTVANLPRGVAMEDISLDEAVALLAEKGKALKPKGAAGRKGGRSAAKAAPAGDAPQKAPRPQGPEKGRAKGRSGQETGSQKSRREGPGQGPEKGCRVKLGNA